MAVLGTADVNRRHGKTSIRVECIQGAGHLFSLMLTRPSPARFRRLEQTSFVSTRVIRRITFLSTLLFTSKSLEQKPSVLNTSGGKLPSNSEKHNPTPIAIPPDVDAARRKW